MQQEEVIIGAKLFYILLNVITDAPKIGTMFKGIIAREGFFQVVVGGGSPSFDFPL